MATVEERLALLLRDGSWTALAAAFFYATLVAAGPWLVAVFSLLALPFLLGFDWRAGDPELLTFLVSFSWSFALALLFGGGGAFAHARLTEDLLYLDRPERLLPNLHLLWIRLLLFAQPLWLLYLGLLSDLPPSFLLALLVSLGLQIGIVLFSGFLATVQRLGTLLALDSFAFPLLPLLAWWWGARGAWELLWLWILVQGLLLASLMVVSWRAYPFERLFGDDWRRPAYRDLFWIGSGINLALWLDKWLFWFGPGSGVLHGALRYNFLYDWPAFLAFLSLIPLFGLLFLFQKGIFLPPFHRYFRSTQGANRLERLHQLGERLAETVGQLFRRFLLAQLLTLLGVGVVARSLLERFGFPAALTGILGNLLPGMGLLALLLWLILLQIHFDDRSGAKRTILLFLVSQAAATLHTIAFLPPLFYGVNVALGTLPPLLLAVSRLNRLLRDLNYTVFMEKNCPYAADRYDVIDGAN